MSDDLFIHRDADFRQDCRWRTIAGANVNLASRTLTASIRSYPARATVNQAMTVLVTDSANGAFRLTLTASETTGLLKGRYVWEVLATTGSTVQRILGGELVVQDTGDEVYVPASELVASHDPV